jgi:hypothetical protein
LCLAVDFENLDCAVAGAGGQLAAVVVEDGIMLRGVVSLVVPLYVLVMDVAWTKQ